MYKITFAHGLELVDAPISHVMFYVDGDSQFMEVNPEVQLQYHEGGREFDTGKVLPHYRRITLQQESGVPVYIMPKWLLMEAAITKIELCLTLQDGTSLRTHLDGCELLRILAYHDTAKTYRLR